MPSGYNRHHLHVDKFVDLKAYKRPNRGMAARDLGRETEQHAEQLKRDVAAAWADAEGLVATRDDAFVGEPGIYLDFETMPDQPLPDLNWKSKGILLANADRVGDGPGERSTSPMATARFSKRKSVSISISAVRPDGHRMRVVLPRSSGSEPLVSNPCGSMRVPFRRKVRQSGGNAGAGRIVSRTSKRKWPQLTWCRGKDGSALPNAKCFLCSAIARTLLASLPAAMRLQSCGLAGMTRISSPATKDATIRTAGSQARLNGLIYVIVMGLSLSAS